MSNLKMSDERVMLGNLLRVARKECRSGDAIELVKIIKHYDSNQELIATLEREKVSLAVDLEYELSRSAKLQADNELLRDELKKVLHNLELLDEDALGQGRMHNTQPWSIRDERIHNISNLLAATAKG